MLRHAGFFIAVALVTATAGCGRNESRAAHENPTLIRERIWIDKVPEKPNEMIHAFAALEEFAPLGFTAHASSYKGHFEVFEYRLEKDRMSLTFPQDGRTATIKIHLERCHSGIPDADLCLMLDHNPWGGPTRYFGLKIDRARELVPSIASLRP